jgi:signal transduction histidine kinase
VDVAIGRGIDLFPIMQQNIPPYASEPAAAFLQTAITVSLAGICFLLWRRYHKKYFLIWSLAWVFYSLRLAAILAFLFSARLAWLYWHQVMTGLTALALLWAALAFSQIVRPRRGFLLLAAFPIGWSYIAIYRMDNFMLAAAPAVAFLSIATLLTGLVFLRHHRRAGSTASLVLGIALLLWSVHHLDYPFLRARGIWDPYGYYIDIMFELAMGAGIMLIVGEELHSGLRTLSALSGHLQAGERIGDLPRELLTRAMTLPAVHGAALFRVDNEGHTRVTHGAGALAHWENEPVPSGAHHVVQQAVATRRPVVHDAKADSASSPETRGYVAALPILTRDDVRGALAVVARVKDPFAALDTDFLVALGRQFGAALEIAELYRGLEERTGELERLAARMVHQDEEERRRLSRELHDETAQVFAAVNMQLGLLRETVPPEFAPRLDRALDLVGEGIRTIRTVTERLRPPLLDDLGLVAAMRGLIDEFVEHQDIEVRFEAPPAPPDLGHDAELALFRALQEALSNVARHADASRVDVALATTTGNVTLRVADNGCGLGAAHRSGHRLTGGTGLEGMRERVSMLRGRMSIHNGDRDGVEIVIDLPLNGGTP